MLLRHAPGSRLPNGHTLLTDSNNNRVVEVDATDAIVWQYATNTMTGSNRNPLPTRAVRLANGTTLISDQFNHRVIEVNPSGAMVLSFGNLNAPGFDTHTANQGLNAPYDAKRVGDFTGLTPPTAGGGDDNHQAGIGNSDPEQRFVPALATRGARAFLAVRP
jgi:hypothetical protein